MKKKETLTSASLLAFANAALCCIPFFPPPPPLLLPSVRLQKSSCDRKCPGKILENIGKYCQSI
jgi:hypothetical protein